MEKPKIKRGPYNKARERRVRERKALERVGIKPGGKAPPPPTTPIPPGAGSDDPLGNGGTLSPPNPPSPPPTDAPPSDPGASNPPSEQVKRTGLEGYEGLATAFHSFFNNAPKFILSLFDKNEKFTIERVTRREAEMFTKSLVKYRQMKQAESGVPSDPADELLEQVILIVGGKIRKVVKKL